MFALYMAVVVLVNFFLGRFLAKTWDDWQTAKSLSTRNMFFGVLTACVATIVLSGAIASLFP